MAAPLKRILRALTPRLRSATVQPRTFSSGATASAEKPDGDGSDVIFVKGARSRDAASASMPTPFSLGSIAGKRFYKEVTTRLADDGNGWTVMLDYRTLKTPSKRQLKLPTLALAKAIAAEWEYQQSDGIRPFTMPLMKLACTALERVPLIRLKTIEYLMKKFHQDLVFCRSPGGSESENALLERQVAKIDPLLDWVKMEFGFRPVVHTSLFGGKQDEALSMAIENALKQMNNFELAAVDALAAAAHSLVIPLSLLRGKLNIEEAIDLIRLEEDYQIDRFGLVEGGHDVEITDLQVQVSSAIVFLELSER